MTVSLYALTFDCTHAADLAQFWSDVLDVPVDGDPSAEFASIGLTGEASTRPHWMFTQVPEPKRTKNRVHVDLVSNDRTADVDRAIAVGATRIGDFDEDGTTWTTLADPQGNEFDLLASQ